MRWSWSSASRPELASKHWNPCDCSIRTSDRRTPGSSSTTRQLAEPATIGFASRDSDMVDDLLEVGDGCHEHPIAYTINKRGRFVHGSATRAGAPPGEAAIEPTRPVAAVEARLQGPNGSVARQAEASTRGPRPREASDSRRSRAPAGGIRRVGVCGHHIAGGHLRPRNRGASETRRTFCIHAHRSGTSRTIPHLAAHTTGVAGEE